MRLLIAVRPKFALLVVSQHYAKISMTSLRLLHKPRALLRLRRRLTATVWLSKLAIGKQAGLTHINVSVDSLDPRLFHQITGENKFHDVMAGIDRAFEVGYQQVKVNVVLLKQFNGHALPSFLNWIKDRPIELRFIELMQTGEMDELFEQQHQSGVSIRNHLIANGWLLKVKEANDGPAQVFVHPDYQGEIGLIMPYEKGFCETCNRLRVSATGKLQSVFIWRRRRRAA